VLPLLATLTVAAVLTFAGSRLGGALAGAADGRLYRLTLFFLTGCLTLHLLLTALQAAGVAWRLPAVAAALGLVVAVAWRWLPGPRARARAEAPPSAPAPDGKTKRPAGPWASAGRPARLPGWGEAVALAALVLYTASALSLWAVNPDFVYHWGLKGHRFYLAHGIDYPYLERSWAWSLHPDYPNLVPELYATTALGAGRFAEPAMMLWSAIELGLLLAALREGLRRAGASGFVAQGTLAAVALILAAYGIGGRTAGGADWLIALALAAALPPLLAPPDRRGAAQIGIIGAFAAAAKIEGIPLAVSLAAAYATRFLGRTPDVPAAASAITAAAAGPPKGRSTRARLAAAGAVMAALVGPATAVVLPWLAEVHRHHLFQAYNSGPLQPARAAPVFAAIGRAMSTPEWHGLPFGLALLPLLLLDRRLRGLAVVIGAQALFYLYVFFSVRIDAVALVATSLPRLVLHLLPVVLVGAAITLDGRGRTAREGAGVAAGDTTVCGTAAAGGDPQR
jgi:hypothetical protein